MKIKKLLMLSLLLSAGIFLKSDSAFAAVRTWDGGGSDNAFATAANWSADTAPGNGDSIVLPLDVLFSGCSADVTLDNDLVAADVTIAGISTSGAKPEDCYDILTIEGNDIKSSGDIIGGTDSYSRMEANITAMGDITIANFDIIGDLVLGSHSVTLGENTIGTGSISGTGTLTLDGDTGGQGGGGGCDGTAYPAPFTGNGSGFTGAIVIESLRGISIGSSVNSLGRSASSITINGGYLSFGVDYNSDGTFTVPLTFNGGDIYAYQAYGESGEDCIHGAAKTVTVSGEVSFSAATSVSWLSAINIHFSGPINGQSNLTIDEGLGGKVTFADGTSLISPLKTVTIADVADCDNMYNASSLNTRLIVNVDCATVIGELAGSPYQTSGTLSGSGKVGFIKILLGGKLAPGLSPGCLSSNNLTMVEGATFEAELGGTTVCTLYDQQRVTGTVTLGNATLSTLRFNNYKFLAGSTFTIIDNDAADAISGTFKDLAEGATFKTDDGSVLKISYVGGTGNDVVLTVISVGTPDTGFGLLMNNPVVTLTATTLAAGVILVMSRRLKFAPKRTRR